MNKKIIAFFAVIFLSVLAFTAWAEEAKVRAEVDRDTVTIGEEIRYTIEARLPSGAFVEFPAPGKELGGLTVKEILPLKGKQAYILETFTPGDYTIPEQAVKYKEKGASVWREAKTDKVEINVESVLAKYPDARDIRDIKVPLGLPSPYAFFIFLLITILIILLIVSAVLYIRKLNMRKKSFVRVKLPYEVAYERLRALKEAHLPEKGRVKEYYIELSGIIRYYLEARFNLRAPEMTTEEFLAKLRTENALMPEHKSILREFLSHSDLVKFAKYGPSASEIDLSFKSAKKVVDQTKEVLPPKEEG